MILLMHHEKLSKVTDIYDPSPRERFVSNIWFLKENVSCML